MTLADLARLCPACGPELERVLVGYGRARHPELPVGELRALAAAYRAARGERPRAACGCSVCAP